MTRATASLPSLSVISWGISTLTGTVLSMMPVRMSQDWKNREILVECTETMVPWTVIHRQPCVIPRRVYLKLLVIFCKISKEYSAICLELWRYRKRANGFACRFSKSLGQWGNRDFAGYATDIPPHTLLKSLMPWSHDRPSICQGRQTHGFYLDLISPTGAIIQDGMRSRKPMKLVGPGGCPL